jgi:hypothetical protein
MKQWSNRHSEPQLSRRGFDETRVKPSFRAPTVKEGVKLLHTHALKAGILKYE